MGCNVINALNNTLFFGFYAALISQGGLVVTVALGGRETPSGLALFWQEGMLGVLSAQTGNLQTPQCSRGGSMALPEPIANRGVSLKFQSLILGFAGSNNPLSL